jgi:membrane-associated phospholipid phosphatase
MAVAAEPGPNTDEATVDRRLALRLLVASALGIVGAFLCYFLMLRTSVGQRLDYSAFTGSVPINPAVLWGKEMRSLTPYVFAVVIVVVVVIGFVRHRPLLGLGGALGAVIAVLATEVLKNHVLSRPFLTRQVARAPHTFPSDHTSAAMACTMALVLVVPARWRSTVAIPAGVYGVLTAVQQLTTSSHYPSDIIGATLLAFAAAAGVAGLLAWFRPVRWARNRYYAPTLAVFGVTAVVAAALSVWGVVRVLSGLGSRAIPAPAAAINYDAFLTGVALIVAVGIAVVISFLALLGDAELG